MQSNMILTIVLEEASAARYLPNVAYKIKITIPEYQKELEKFTQWQTEKRINGISGRKCYDGIF
jgi:hypothetical protein